MALPRARRSARARCTAVPMGAGQSRDQFGAALEILLTREVDWGDAVFWNELWDVATTAEDVFSFLGPEEVERLLRERPSNLRHVCSLAVAQLCQFVETPLPIYFDNALNCIRVLTRVMPTLVSAEGSDFVEATFWEDGEAEEGSEASDAAVAGGVRAWHSVSRRGRASSYSRARMSSEMYSRQARPGHGSGDCGWRPTPR